eukprot:g1070.t1
MPVSTGVSTILWATSHIVKYLHQANRKLLHKGKKKHHTSKNTTICMNCLPKSEKNTVYLSAGLLLAIVLLSLYLLIRRIYFGKEWKKHSTQSVDYAFLPATDSEREGSLRDRGQSDSANSEMSYSSSIASHDVNYHNEYFVNNGNEE